MYQSTLYLFPEELSAAAAPSGIGTPLTCKARATVTPTPGGGGGGSSSGSGAGAGAALDLTSFKPWPRIGLMLTMAPAPTATRTDSDSAAGTCHAHAGTRTGSPYRQAGVPVTERLLAASIIGAAAKAPAGVKFGHLQKIAEGYGKQGQTVLRPALRPGLTDQEVEKFSGGTWTSVQALRKVRLGAKGEAKKVDELVETLGMDGLTKFAHPRAVSYICGDSE